jgi:peptide/nickel transport system permease protein
MPASGLIFFFIHIMSAYLLRRIWQMIPTMLGVILLVFFLFNWVGGDPAYILAGKISTRTNREYPPPAWCGSALLYSALDFYQQIVHLDFGNSWSTGESVSHLIASRLGPSLTVLIPLTILETLLAVALALVIAFRRGSLTDRAVMIACTAGMSVSILVYIILGQYFSLISLAGFRYKAGAMRFQKI